MNQHGTYQVARSLNVVRLEAKGPFNDVALANYERTIDAVIEDFPEGPWAVLAILDPESLLIPEAEQALVAISQKRLQQGMGAVALVCDPAATGGLVRGQFERVHRVAGSRFKLFETESAGMTWLAAQGFEFDPASAVSHT